MFDITPPHLHLLLNHLPVVGIMGAVLLLLFGMIRNNAELKRTALVSFVLVAILSFLANSTGCGAARAVRNFTGIEQVRIHDHSSVADTSSMVSYILGVIALIGLVLAWVKKGTNPSNDALAYVRHHKEPRAALLWLCLVIGLVEVYLLAWTANLGGRIRHPEIDPGFSIPAQQLPSPSK